MHRTPAPGAEKKTTIVSGNYLQKLLGCTKNTLANYVLDGLAVRVAKNKYDLEATVPKVVRHFVELASGRAGRDKEYDPIKANVMLKNSQQRLADIRAERLAGNLVSLEAVVESWGELAEGCKLTMLSLPSRARARIHKLNGKDQKALEAIVREMLTEFAFGTQKPRVPRDRGEMRVE